EHRADALFVLPQLPATAAILGVLPGWSDDLRDRRIEEVDAGRADVVVADPSHAAEAAAVGAPALIVDGGPRLGDEIRRRYPASRPLIPLPVSGSPALFVDPSQSRAARYRIEPGILLP